jgi:hypothetical protein
MCILRDNENKARYKNHVSKSEKLIINKQPLKKFFLIFHLKF